jgi:hypothetical protein
MNELRFTDRDQIEEWLESQPPEIARAIGVRLALRLIPLGLSVANKSKTGRYLRFSASILRAASVSWVAIRFNEEEVVKINMNQVHSDIVSASVSMLDSPNASLAANTLSFAIFNIIGESAHLSSNIFVAAENCVKFSGGSSDSIWSSISTDAQDVASGINAVGLAGRPLWQSQLPPKWFSDAWSKDIAALTSEGDWDVWTSWFEDRIAGRSSAQEIEAAYAKIPPAVWSDGPLAANSWLKGRLAAINSESGESIALTSSIFVQDPLGSPIDIADGKAKFASIINESDEAAAQDKQVIQRHERARLRASEARQYAGRLSNQRGFEGISATLDEFSLYLDGDTKSVAANISAVWELSTAVGTFLERDDEARTGRGGLTEPLDPEPRAILDQLIIAAAPFVRSFPTARDNDDAVRLFKESRAAIEPARKLIEKGKEQLVIHPDAERLLDVALAAAERSGGLQAQKSRNWFSATVRNIAIAFMVVSSPFAGGALKTAGEHFWDKSAIGEKIDHFLLDGEAEIAELMKDLPSDIRAAVREVMRRLKGKDFQPHDPANSI